jgi:hypothetical protein
MAIGTLTLYRFCGEERFGVSEAIARAFPDGDEIRINLAIKTEKTPLKTLCDTEEHPARPNAEVDIRVSRTAFAQLTGTRCVVPRAWDADADDHAATFYYYGHNDLDDNEVDFLECKDNRYRVRWTGTTNEVNNYDGNRLRTRVHIDAWFTLKD